MFTRLGTTVVRFRWLVIGAWVVAATLLSLTGARWLYDVTTSDSHIGKPGKRSCHGGPSSWRR